MSEITKFCRDCKHRRRPGFRRLSIADICHHPLSVEWPHDARVTGEPPRHQECRQMRDYPNAPCGKEGRLWELK